jgi:NTP pyrophosphatase (non-canonical NTP hydrolase)
VSDNPFGTSEVPRRGCPSITELVQECYEISRDHGFWEHETLPAPGLWNRLRRKRVENPSIIPEKLMLAVSELAEAMESERDGDTNTAEEIADTIIRLFDVAGKRGYDLENIILTKMAKNRERPYKHGRQK